MIAFSCPHCGAQLQVKESLAGKTGPCPSCSGVVQAPAAGTSSLSGSADAGEHKSAVRATSPPTLRLPTAAEDTAAAIPQRAPLKDYPFLVPPQGPDELGRLGHYLIQKVLGIGAMGIVFQAKDLHLQRLVALKVMKPSLAAFAEFHQRFLREAQLTAAIEHEHIVTIYQVGEDRGVPFLAMKLLQGETLEDRLSRTPGRLPLPQLLRIGREIAEGLAAAHAKGLIHRDIKPSNVWLEAGGDRVKIVDFGLARGTGGDARFTQAGAVIGTPSYMAPEQANAEEVDARCDLFSLGAVLYRASTGVPPFGDKDTLSVLAALVTKTPEPPHTIVAGLPRAFSDLVMRLLAKDRDSRPRSARDVVEAIKALERAEAARAPDLVEDRGLRIEDRGSRIEEEVRDPRSSILDPRRDPRPPVREDEKEASGSDVRRKGPKKVRFPASRRKKRRKVGSDWGRWVLVASLVLLAVALLVFLLGVIRRATQGRAAVPEDPVPLQVAGRTDSLARDLRSRSDEE